jgi:hypothetical protein
MKRFLIAAALAATFVTTAAFAADVGVSLSIGEPGFYGRLDIGGYPQPQLVYRQPIAVERVPTNREPIYLHVRPGHASHWKNHCREYSACGERVYFVHNNWYHREYVPRYQQQHRDGHRDEQRGDQRNDHHGDDRDHGRNH